MGYSTEHRKMAPLLEAARQFDIASNPAPAALFEAGSGGLQIWCTPEDNPGELWSKVEMIAGAFSRPCEYVASAHWKWAEEGEPAIIGIALSTDAYALRDARRIKAGEIHNRPEDIVWAKGKIEWLWQASTAGGTMPPIVVDEK
ncbi:MAG: hypothetical protein A3F84_18420 [Candidatus Handelsmanbacteria bacterium RIFCSPLOWO2_12_FULL_64_10]|uniref:Uncharacterized protein n=1 Tax=Handelsmanbacteria sp. (strain RIFCSPLOWO2_12_FULL_64_10) TaxID=1817868 RepID=A0A1F6C974_HANXR|nr:MAG: hypothetical protein A3F84_18420 [Candidatus Handelsmanbacteria bacterium RIFCSPLOWO2_12_FULL_64_10]